MKRKKNIGKRLFAFLGITVLLITGQTEYNGQADTSDGIKAEYGKEDLCVMPDRYNTGCTGEFVQVSMGEVTNDEGVLIIPGSNGTRFVLDFGYRNKEVTGTVYFENMDFSAFDFWTYHEDMVERDIHVVFNNCKFARVYTGKTDSRLSYEFNRCSMTGFYGSNAVLTRCRFGGGACDGVVPFRNVTVKECFFGDMTSVLTEKNVHIDGTQLYGAEGIDVENVSFLNCRFSVPALNLEGNGATVNACIMLQLEYSNARNVLFRDCYINGGGYSIYARSVKDSYTLENIKLEGLRFGSASMFGIFYPDMEQSVEVTDIRGIDSLYVASVWWDEGETHFSVTNDTNRERTLQIETDKGSYTYTIPACPAGKEFTAETRYEDLPFDVEIVVPEDCDYAVCFDATWDGAWQQIRYVNRTEDAVWLSASVNKAMQGAGDKVVSRGNCGKNVTYTLTGDGVLTLSGTGSTDSYHSQKFPEWSPYLDRIKEIRVEEGIEGLGAMIFGGCTNVSKVSLPNSLKKIGQYGFRGCTSLTEMVMPKDIEELGRNVFKGIALQKLYYKGVNWESVTLGDENEHLTECMVPACYEGVCRGTVCGGVTGLLMK